MKEAAVELSGAFIDSVDGFSSQTVLTFCVGLWFFIVGDAEPFAEILASVRKADGAVAIEDGMIGMKQDGIVKASLGYLELAELMKIF